MARKPLEGDMAHLLPMNEKVYKILWGTQTAVCKDKNHVAANLFLSQQPEYNVVRIILCLSYGCGSTDAISTLMQWASF